MLVYISMEHTNSLRTNGIHTHTHTHTHTHKLQAHGLRCQTTPEAQREHINLARIEYKTSNIKHHDKT